MSFLVKRRRRPLFELQLTAMIDIFSMIVIFLIKGTVFGMTDVAVPNNLKLPKSVSQESLESGPQILISKDSVKVSALQETLPLRVFSFEASQSDEIKVIKQKLKQYVEKVPEANRRTGLLLNVVADQETSYKTIFDIVKVFREVGFESVLFVATGPNEGEAQK